MGKKWLPLESNPEVLNDFVNKLGYDTSKYAFCDVFGLDEVRFAFFSSADCTIHSIQRITRQGPQELLQMVPQPVVAVLFLFPVTKESEAAKDTGTVLLPKEHSMPRDHVFIMLIFPPR